MKHFSLLIFLGLLFPFIVLAQIDSLSEALTESIEEDNGLIEVLEDLKHHPININSASREELRIFPFLSETEIDSIIFYRPFTQKRQVKGILDKETYNLLRPFFIVKEVPQLWQMQITQRNYLPFYKVNGIRENKFRGSTLDNYSKLRLYTSTGISGGFLLQKDLGENEIYDHLSGFLQWHNSNQNLTILLGSYQVQFGHGLVLDAPYGKQKSIFTLAPLRMNKFGGRHYLTSSEFAGFHGMHVQYKPVPFITASVFYANTLRDGNVDASYQYVTSLNNTGYHRSNNEYIKKDLIREKTIGGLVKFDINSNIESGIAAVQIKYNPSLVYNSNPKSESTLRRSFFHFTGNQINLYSYFLHAYTSSFEISSEISTNQFQKFSHSLNFLLPFSNGGIGFKWWNISKSFQSPFGHSFDGSSNFPQAVQGYYAGFEQRLSKEFKCSSYWMIEKDLWRTYFDPMPTSSKEFLLNFDIKLASQTNLILRYQFSDNLNYRSDYQNAFSEYRRKIRIDFIKQLSKSIRLRSRIEKVFINYSDYLSRQQGTNLYQDMSWQISPLLNVKARFSSFISDDYDSRIYEFENDLPGTFSNYALSGKGTKWYLLVRLNLFDNLRLWLKYRSIHYDGIESIGSGDLKSEGNTRQDARFQLDYIL